MVILDGGKSKRFVGGFYGFQRILLKTYHCTDCVHILDDDVGFLINCLEKTEFIFVGIN